VEFPVLFTKHDAKGCTSQVDLYVEIDDSSIQKLLSRTGGEFSRVW